MIFLFSKRLIILLIILKKYLQVENFWVKRKKINLKITFNSIIKVGIIVLGQVI